MSAPLIEDAPAARATGAFFHVRAGSRVTPACEVQVPSAFSSLVPFGEPQPVHGSQPALAL